MFRRPGRLVAVVVVVAIAAISIVRAVSSDDSSSTSATSQAATASKQGGTLRLGTQLDPQIDPQVGNRVFQLQWCCLSRTIMAFPLLPPNKGGATVQPDLAAERPTVSDGARTWTVKLKHGLHYAPPYQDVEITAPDFVRAFRRIEDPKVLSPQKGQIGFSAGLKKIDTPDRYTLVFHLAKPDPIFDLHLTTPATSPIPPGAATGHAKDYGRYMAASGPYMVEGSSKTAPSTGYQPGQSLTLVRNPSWSRKSDPLREANPDRIVIEIGGSSQDLFNKITAGDLDGTLGDAGAPPPAIVRQYESDPSLRGRLHINPQPYAVRVEHLNLAMPPFDDVHVRRAVDYILDRDAVRRVLGGPTAGTLAYHTLSPAVTQSKVDFMPYRTASPREALAKAQAEMKLSKYDPDKTGRCSVPACSKLLTGTLDGDFPEETNVIKDSLAKIGINLSIVNFDTETVVKKCLDPKSHMALCAGVLYNADSLDPGWWSFLIDSAALPPASCCDLSLLGASAKQLTDWGYNVTAVPSVEATIHKCQAAPLGAARVTCWSGLDRTLAEQIVPYVPVLFPAKRQLVSARVTNYTYDAFGQMSLSHIALKPSAGR